MVNSSQRQKTTRKRHAHKQAKTYKHENKGTSVTAVLTCRQQNHFRHPCFCTHQNKLKTNKDDTVNPQTRGQGISMNMTKRERGKRKEERMPLMKRGAQFHALTPQKLQKQKKKKRMQQPFKSLYNIEIKCKQRQWSRDNYGNNNTEKIGCSGPSFLAFLFILFFFASRTALRFEGNNPSKGK